MKAEDRGVSGPRSSLTTRGVPELPVTARAETDFSLNEMEKLIRGVLQAPSQEIDARIVALVRAAAKQRSRFTVSLALRALQLEQALRETQQQVIRLQWAVAQVKRGQRAPATDSDHED